MDQMFVYQEFMREWSTRLSDEVARAKKLMDSLDAQIFKAAVDQDFDKAKNLLVRRVRVLGYCESGLKNAITFIDDIMKGAITTAISTGDNAEKKSKIAVVTLLGRIRATMQSFVEAIDDEIAYYEKSILPVKFDDSLTLSIAIVNGPRTLRLLANNIIRMEINFDVPESDVGPGLRMLYHYAVEVGLKTLAVLVNIKANGDEIIAAKLKPAA